MTIRALAIALTVALGCGHPASPGESAAAEHTPAAEVGTQAPDAPLTRASGAKVALAEVLHQHARTVVVFYRGFW
jgi:hypothetical protein